MSIQPNADFDDAPAAELRRRIPDLTERIQSQDQRLQKIKRMGAGLADAMEALLVDMVERRDTMQAQLADIEAGSVKTRRPGPGRTYLWLVGKPVGALPYSRRAINNGWHIELFPGGVRLQRVRSSRV
jgi:hypothetical protein